MPQTFQTCLEDQKLLRDGMCHDLSKRTTDKYLIPAMLTIEKYELSPIIVQRKRLLKLDIKDELQNQIHGMLVMIGIALFYLHGCKSLSIYLYYSIYFIRQIY